MQTNPAHILYNNIDRRVKESASQEKTKSPMSGLLAKTMPSKDKQENNIAQPMERVVSYVKMLREERESEV